MVKVPPLKPLFLARLKISVQQVEYFCTIIHQGGPSHSQLHPIDVPLLGFRAFRFIESRLKESNTWYSTPDSPFKHFIPRTSF